ncbi:MAG: radical SAM protein [Acidimicrobiales bacterium]|nr:radical SAM protein [Acidimicrobiales bacterium]
MSVAEAVQAGTLPGRVWFYSNYHCNLACTYCLTESAPSARRRVLAPATIIELAGQARRLGFTDLGITGGEPFLLPSLPELLTELAQVLPTVVLSNGTLFTEARIARLAPLAGLPLAIQISLDAPDPERNDELRGPENFAKVAAAVPQLVRAGIRVRVATTVEPDRLDEADHARLCELHRSWGVPDEDHLVRPVIRRGRADESGMGVVFDHSQIPAELTITADGSFWSPFGPTVRQGRLDTDLLLTRTVDPLSRPAEALLALVGGLPAGADAQIGIR